MDRKVERKPLESFGDPMKEHFERTNQKKFDVSLYISNIPDDLEQSGLRNLFMKVGKVTSCTILPKKDQRRTRIGFINYATKYEAQKAIELIHQSEPFHLKVELKRLSKSPQTRQIEDGYSDFEEDINNQRHVYQQHYNVQASDTSDDLDDDLDTQVDLSNMDRIEVKVNATGDGNFERKVFVHPTGCQPLSQRPEFNDYRKRHKSHEISKHSFPSNVEKWAASCSVSRSHSVKSFESSNSDHEETKVNASVQHRISKCARKKNFISKTNLTSQNHNPEVKQNTACAKVQTENENTLFHFKNLNTDLTGKSAQNGATGKSAQNGAREKERKKITAGENNILDGKRPETHMFNNVIKPRINIPNKESRQYKSEVKTEIVPSVPSIKFEQGQQVTVMVSQVDSLKFIWVQLFDNIIRELDDLTTLLLRESSERTNFDFTPVEHGIYLIQYSQDHLWYRGQIVKIDSNNLYSVVYIDYGNREANVERSKIKLLSERSLKYPAQAIRCKTLPEIVNQYKDAEEFAMYVLSKAVQLTVVKFDSDFPVVALNDVESADDKSSCINNENEKSPLAVAGNISLDLKSEKKTHDIDTIKSAVTVYNSTLNLIEVGDKCVLTFTEFSSNSEFWASIVSDKHMAQYETLIKCQESLNKQLSEQDSCEKDVGDLVLARSSDGCYYRASVLSKVEKKYKVFFIDYGNAEKTTDVRSLSEELTTIPSFSVNCSIDDGSINTQVKDYVQSATDLMTATVIQKLDGVVKTKFEDLVLNSKEVSISIVPWFKKLTGALKEESQSRVNLSPNEKEKSKSKSNGNRLQSERTVITKNSLPKIHLDDEDLSSVLILNVNDANDIAVIVEKLVSDNAKLSALLLDLLESDNECYSGELCELVCAKSKMDNNWYRAEILNIFKSTVEVYFIDFGNREEVALTDIRKIPIEATKFGMLALTVALESTPSTLEPLKLCVLESLLNMKIINKNTDPIQVQFFTENNQPIIPPSSSKLQTTKTINNVKFSTLPFKELTVAVLHVENPHQIFCLPNTEDDVYGFSKLAEDIHAYVSSVESRSYEPQVDEMCIVKFEDGQWYRAIRMDSEEKFLMNFVDFGNCCVITSGNIRPINDELFEYPIVARRCRLSEYENKDFDSADVARVKKLFPTQGLVKVQVTGFDKKENVYSIKLS